MAKQFKNREDSNDFEEKKVIYEKLKKVKAFLESLQAGSSIERDHRSFINVDVDEEKLHDIETEIETMIQIMKYQTEQD